MRKQETRGDTQGHARGDERGGVRRHETRLRESYRVHRVVQAVHVPSSPWTESVGPVLTGDGGHQAPDHQQPQTEARRLHPHVCGRSVSPRPFIGLRTVPVGGTGDGGDGDGLTTTSCRPAERRFNIPLVSQRRGGGAEVTPPHRLLIGRDPRLEGYFDL